MEHPDLLSELALIERALQPEQFRFVVVQFNHYQALARLSERLRMAFPERAWAELDGRKDGGQAILAALRQPPAGLLLIRHAEALLDDEGFTRSLNQRRDALSRHPLGLILLLPSGGDYLQRLARAMPDLWSLRNLSAELFLPPDPLSGGQFITLEGKSYASFSSKEEADAELGSLDARIFELESLPGSRPLLAVLLARKGKIQLRLSDYKAAEATFQQSLALAREVGDRSLEATALTELGEVLTGRGHYESALQHLEQSLAIAREIGDKKGEGATLNNLSQIYAARGDYETALAYLEQSLRIQREIGDKAGEGATLNNLATTAHARGDYETALAYLEQSLRIRREIGDKAGEGATLNNLSQIYDSRGDYETALAYLEQSLRIQREIGDTAGMIPTLHNMAQIVWQAEDVEKYMEYEVEALQLARQTGNAAGIFHVGQNLGMVLYHNVDKEKGLALLVQAYEAGSKAGFPQAVQLGQLLASLRGA